MLAVAGNEPVRVGKHSGPVGGLWAALPEADWAWACGLRAKGPRVYDWQCRVLTAPEDTEGDRYVLFRRSCTDPAAGCQAYLVHAVQRCLLETLVRVAGMRGCIKSAFKAAKQEAGLDEYEVRSATGWYRHVTLALLAVLRATTLPDAAAPVKTPAAAWRPSNAPTG